ncbi:hypothetical protein ACFX13_026979 [Malus domestica]
MYNLLFQLLCILYDMDAAAARTQRFWNIGIRRLLLIIGGAVAIVVVSQCFELPYDTTFFFFPADIGSISTATMFANVGSSNMSKSGNFSVGGVEGLVGNDTEVSDSEEESRHGNDTRQQTWVYGLALGNDSSLTGDGESMLENNVTLGKSYPVGTGGNEDGIFIRGKTDFKNGYLQTANESVNGYREDNEPGISSGLKVNEVRNEVGLVPVVSQESSTKRPENLNVDSKGNVEQNTETQIDHQKIELQQPVSVTLDDNSTMTVDSVLRKWNRRPTSISQMNSLLLQSAVSSRSMKLRRYSARDRELQSAKLEIENAPIIKDNAGLSASVFRNLSKFIRSYDLMGHMLKVYIYSEGEKPVFHQPLMRGIYASEGWFMKLIEGNKKFVVRDPRKAHVFYLPFDSHMLRLTIPRHSIHGKSKTVLEEVLQSYVGLISRKYPFWNRTKGADHFLVACHDWAPKLTKQCMKNCIRSLCNAHVDREFEIGKDTSLPVTYIRSVENPLQDLGGKPASERSILAFFAGGLHGYLRPILLHYWANKEPDMKIFGPMPHDIEGKRMYREYMKSSKYCICARGYEVHTPRIVEAIFYECVPVIISDSYMPPFFEVFNWEAFAVFIQERDIPNLRNILLSIPEDKYLTMMSRIKMVQQHFFWHKKPKKYDLFHMVLHSVWYNRILQLKTR